MLHVILVPCRTTHAAVCAIQMTIIRQGTYSKAAMTIQPRAWLLPLGSAIWVLVFVLRNAVTYHARHIRPTFGVIPAQCCRCVELCQQGFGSTLLGWLGVDLFE